MNRFAPKDSKTAQNFKGTLKRVVGRFAPSRFLVALMLLCTAMAVFLNVNGPNLLGQATNAIFDGIIGKRLQPGMSKAQAAEFLKTKGHTSLAEIIEKSQAVPGKGIDFNHLAHVLLLVIVLYAGAAFFSWAANILGRTIVQRMGRNLRDEVSRHIDDLPLAYLDKHSRGDLVSKVTNDVDNLLQVMQISLNNLFNSLFLIVGIGGMMLYVSPRLTLLSLIVLPLGGIATALLMKKAAPYFRQQWQETGQLSAAVEDTFSGHLVMSSYGRKDDLLNDFEISNRKLYRASRLSQFLSGMVQPVIGVASNLSYVVVAVAGTLEITSGNLTLGAVQAFIQYSRQFNQPMGQLASLTAQLQSGMASAERIFEFLDEPKMPSESDKTVTLGQVKGAVEFRNVRFGYEPGKTVINNLNLVVEPGETIAIVGATGAGKTTLVNLLMRFYEIDEGQILLDGTDTASISKHELRSHFGMVLQDTWLFRGSIADNIAYGAAHEEDATREKVIEAAKALGIDHMIRVLPRGYDTLLDDTGEGLSSGQKQLLTIARAFIANPEIMILDEATSSVDTRTEQVIQQGMARLREGRTAFVIAHRLSTIKDASRIVVMDHGDVVEIGTHAELLGSGGVYAKLYQSQFEGALD